MTEIEVRAVIAGRRKFFSVDSKGRIRMFRTPDGERVLEGPEAILVSESIDVMLDTLLEEFESDGGRQYQETYEVPAFDNLPIMQRLGLLHEMTRAMFLAEVPPPEVTANREATIAAIINNIKHFVQFEIDSCFDEEEHRRFWRQRVLACALSIEPEYFDDLYADEREFDESSFEFADWEPLIDMLAHQFLWDEDYDETHIQDMPPEQAKATRHFMDIEENYFASLPPDPDEAEFATLRRQTREICSKVSGT